MLYHPSDYVKKEGFFCLDKSVYAETHPILDKPVLKELFFGHAFHLSALTVTHTDALVFRVGSAEAPALHDCDYAINVEKTGIAVTARTEKDLIRGFLLLLDAIESERAGEVKIPCFRCAETPRIACRMVHFCIFPDTELWELERFVRFVGALRYTHLILEFWGMLRYDTLGALAWAHAFTKEELAPILTEARDLGMEIVPMFNHWGHATASRAMHGKHVVLDNDPSLSYLFSPDGWRWAIERDEVKTLLRAIRRELIELCGEGSYFHIGCDEAYNFAYTEEHMRAICAYFSELADDLESVGRRALIWGDMFLYNHPHYHEKNRYDANAASAEAEKFMLSLLDRRLIVADWQYHVAAYPVETSLLFQSEGFDVITCPWEKTGDIENCVKTVIDNGLGGVMHTTWHTLSAHYPQVARTALLAIEGEYRSPNAISLLAAALLRKVSFVNGDYRKAGWAKQEIGVIT